MRITIDATSLLFRSAGVKNYTWHWIRALQRAAGPHEIRAFPLIDTLDRLDHERSVLAPWATAPRLGLVFLGNLLGGAVLRPLLGGSDVFHVSNQVRRPPHGPKITATIHDLTVFLMPEFHTEANIRADRWYADRVLRRASGLIAVSENTRQDAIRVLGLSPDRVTTIYSGVDERFFTALPQRSERPYVLFVGTIEPRKNVGLLLDAWAALKASIRAEFELVVAGPAGWNSEATVRRLKSGGVRYLGYVGEEELPGLTAGATAFVYPSLYEGFGFPVAQAMAAGVPVITSGTSCLPEVAGGGAVYVDPRSEVELTGALERVLSTPGMRAQLGAAGRARASSEFRWEVTAQRSLKFFENID